MRTVTLRVSASGQVAGPIPFNQYVEKFNVGFGCVKSGTGDITYSVEHSYDGDNWFEHSTVSGQTGNAEGAYNDIVKMARLKATAVSGSAEITGTFIQVNY